MALIRRIFRYVLEMLVGSLTPPSGPAPDAADRLRELTGEIVRAITGAVVQSPEFQWLARSKAEAEAKAAEPQPVTLPAEEDDHFADPREPIVFEYWDGEKTRKLEPLRTWLDLQAHPTININLLAERIAAGDASVYAELIPFCREFFGIVSEWSEANPSGVTDQAAIDVLYRFWDFVDAAKKNIDTPRNLPRLTEVRFWVEAQKTPESDSASQSIPITPET